MINRRKIGIIGVGPRGGYALEQLIIELIKQDSLTQIQLLLFEATGKFGNGPVYNLNQASSNWINITERILELEKRDTINSSTFNIPSFPSYHQWIDKDFNNLPEDFEDTYPPRAKIGEYLSLRFQTLVESLLEAEVVILLKEKVVELITSDTNQLTIKTDVNIHRNIDEVLLTIGHQPTDHSQQISEWKKFVSHHHHLNLFTSPYPVAEFLNCKQIDYKSTIGIRGFGLAMIDVIRAIAEKFGHFTRIDEENKLCRYHSEKELKNLLLPFSLDGLPPVPKPLNAKIDNLFKPSENQLLQFEKKIGNPASQKKAKDFKFLVEAFAPIAADIFVSLKNTYNPNQLSKEDIKDIIILWLKDQNLDHHMVISSKKSTKKNMKDFVQMATGKKAMRLDYCIGQVWRHCQPSIYKELSYNKCSDSVFLDIITLDESTKRYSYGPPVESIQQLLALIDAGVLNLDMINNPKIKLTQQGWSFQGSNTSINAKTMIDSVLDSPQIKSVNSSLVKNMLSNNLINPVHDKLGVLTDEEGYLILNHTTKKISIALLGRLAKGTVIGVDAILECFGKRPRKWAKKAASNHSKWLSEEST